MKRACLISVVMLFSVTVAFLGSASAGSKSAFPPNGVYTCPWITKNPTAATLARVSCSEDMTNPGSTVTPSEAAESEVTLMANGCQRVPSSGAIGPGVYAATTFEYSKAWIWTNASQFQEYWWYI